MNEKCAAGTGRFLEMVAEVLGVDLPDLAELAFAGVQKIKISNICTVFAAQEIMNYLARGENARTLQRVSMSRWLRASAIW